MKPINFTAKIRLASVDNDGLVLFRVPIEYRGKLKDIGTMLGQDVFISLTDGSTYTAKMNRLFHSLVRDVQRFGVAPYWGMLGREPRTFEEIKTWAKVELGGARVERVGELTWIQSWTEFAKENALQCIDAVINWLIDSGCHIDGRILDRNDLGGSNEK